MNGFRDIGPALWSRTLLLTLLLPLLRCQGQPDEPTPVALALSPEHPRIAQSTGQAFAVHATYADGRSKDLSSQIQWSVVDEQGRPASSASRASGPIAGLITVENPGHYRVRATLGGQVVETPLEVTTAYLTSVAISPIEPTIVLGASQQFTLTAHFSDGSRQDVTALSAWSLKSLVGTGVAVIDSSGLATSKAVGMVTVAGRYKSKSSSTSLAVNARVLTGFAISPATATVNRGSTQKFTATGTYSDGTVQDLSNMAAWSVADITGTGVASTDSAGNVTGNAAGKASVTASYGSSTASATLVVNNPVAPCSFRDRFQQVYGHAWNGADVAFVTSDGKQTRGLDQLDLAAQKTQVPDIVKVKGNANDITEIQLLAPGAGTVLASHDGAYIYGLGYAMWLEVNGYGEAGITEMTLIRQFGLEEPSYQQLVALFRVLTKTAESQVPSADLADFQAAAAQLMAALENGSLTFAMGTGHGADFWQTAQIVDGKTFSFQLSNGLGLDPQLGFQRDGVWGPLWQSYGPTGGWSASQPGMQPKCGGCTVDRWAGTTYQLCDGPSDRATAETACQAYGGVLANVSDVFANSFLRGMAPNAGSAFIGLNDLAVHGSYVWATGAPATYLDWAPGQPDDYMGQEHCVQLYDAKSSTQWNDISCVTSLPHLCQLP